MKITAFVLLIFLFLINISSSSTYACGWFYTINAQGKQVIKGEGENLHLYRHFSKEETLEQLKKIENSLAILYNYKEHSDYAMLLSRVGKMKDALMILEKLNHEHPNEYILMANLGTLYELNGKNQEALDWIKKAIDKNPESHHGSEWVHVKILEAKLKLQYDANWLKNNHVVDISKFKAKHLSQVDLKKMAELEAHLGYQLHERVPYTPHPDQIVFQLLMDLAELNMINDLLSAQVAYSFATIFTDNFNEKKLIQTKIKEVETLIRKYNKTPSNQSESSFLTYFMLTTIILTVVIFFIWRFRR